MKTLVNVIRRNLKLFFKDKGMFFSALITPMILLVLYATFLANVYRESFATALPDELTVWPPNGSKPVTKIFINPSVSNTPVILSLSEPP